MKTINRIVAFVFTAALLIGGSAHQASAQSSPPVTTLGSALASGSSTTSMPLVSTTGISANWACLVEHELVTVTTVVNSTTLTVRRAQRGNAVAHPSGSYVICGPSAGTFNVATGATNGVFLNSPPTGTCTASNSQYLPVVVTSGADPRAWIMSNCNNGRWVDQTLIDDVGSNITRYCTTQGLLNGFTLLTSFTSSAAYTIGTNQTPVAGSVYFGSVFVPQTTLVTGITALNGTVAATDDLIYVLYRADGTKIANTLATGTAPSGANRFQNIALTATYLATGPARYWIGVSAEGTTTRLTTVPAPIGAGTGDFMGLLGSSIAGTSGTYQNLVGAYGGTASGVTTALPTALIANTSPVACTY